MASITSVTGSNTPNEGRIIWNANDTAINNEVIAATAAIAAATGGLVGRTQTQTLTNKTLVSSYRGGTNTLSVSRRDLEATSLFLVASNSGSVSDIDVTQSTQYTLSILGTNGLQTYVTSNILYVRNAANCILNETSQVLGVGVASVTAGNIAEFDGNIKVNGRIAVGSEHTSLANTVLHLKEDAPELRIETVASGIAYETLMDDGGNNFKWTANFVTPGADYLQLDWNGSQLIRFSNSTAVTITPSTTFNGATNTITGNLVVNGTLTAENLVATATDVVINNGPVTISGGWSYIADGAIEHDKLSTTTAGRILASSVSTGIIAGHAVTYGTGADEGDISMSVAYGDMRFYFVQGTMKLDYFQTYNNNTILGGTGEAAPYGLRAYTCDPNGDITFTRNSTTLTFNIDSGVIDNDNINASAGIVMSKTNFNVSVSGILYNSTTGTLSLDPNVESDILFKEWVPVGTIIAWAGDDEGYSSTDVYEPTNAPGWLFCNGAVLSGGQYSDLINVLGNAWGGGGRLPDLRGTFLRGINGSTSIDPGPRSDGNGSDVGSTENDSLESHTHAYIDSYYPLHPDYGETGAHAEHGEVYRTISNNAKTTSPTGDDETRPRNTAIAYLIKY